MSKHKQLYTVVCYIGDIHSHCRKALYQTTKLSDAEDFVAEYTDSNPTCVKIYIERSFARKLDKRRSFID